MSATPLCIQLLTTCFLCCAKIIGVEMLQVVTIDIRGPGVSSTRKKRCDPLRPPQDSFCFRLGYCVFYDGKIIGDVAEVSLGVRGGLAHILGPP